MSNYDAQPHLPEQSTLNHDQVTQTLRAAATLDHIQNSVQFGDYIINELGGVKYVAEEEGYSSRYGEAALIGVALGTVVNNTEKEHIYHHAYPSLMDKLTEIGIEEEDKSFIGGIVTHIAEQRANTAVILDIVGGFDTYVRQREKEGADADLIGTTLFAIGFGVSTLDQVTKNNMAERLRKQVK